MARKKIKKLMDEECSDEELEDEVSEEGFIDDLEDEAKPIEEKKEEGDETLEYLKKVESTLKKHNNAITVNQKYIKKMWALIKENQENFKLLYESR